MILKCKMCGGDIAVTEGAAIGICQYCGSTMTLPQIASDKRIELFNRGNEYRRLGEFDKALSIYEQIIIEDTADAEAHWCAAISRFGIEYVEDPVSLEYIPTCHRASFDSFLGDMDYKAAIELSDGVIKRQYQKDAARIEEVRMGILSTSQNEEAYDIFICYKETDTAGRRTQDSVLAQDIYKTLMSEGYNVFFSRITLEDKVGTEYEPYIFAALNSAKVMIVIGTSKENLESVWVKNEWSRFLTIMKKDRTKVLLPCYKGMNPYSMPEGLSSLQGYDMAAIGFIQDLTHGIGKIIPKTTPVTKETYAVDANSIEVLLKKLDLYGDNSDYEKIIKTARQIIDIYPDNVYAYEKLVCASYKISSLNGLMEIKKDYSKSKEYQMFYRLVDDGKRTLLDKQYSEWKLKNKKHKRKLFLILIVLLFIFISVFAVITMSDAKNKQRDKVKDIIELSNNFKIEEARGLIKDINGKEQIHLSKYIDAAELLLAGDYELAKIEFVALGDYYNTDFMVEKCVEGENESVLASCLKAKNYAQIGEIVKQWRSEEKIDADEVLDKVMRNEIENLIAKSRNSDALNVIGEYRKIATVDEVLQKEVVSATEDEMEKIMKSEAYARNASILGKKILKNTDVGLTSKGTKYYVLARLAENPKLWKEENRDEIEDYDWIWDHFMTVKDSIFSCGRGDYYLTGKWKDGNYYFSYDCKGWGHFSCNLPYNNYGDSYDIEKNILYTYSESNPSEHVNQYSFEIVDKDTVQVYCYKNGSTYVLKRQ